jgi:hypothetical protein
MLKRANIHLYGSKLRNPARELSRSLVFETRSATYKMALVASARPVTTNPQVDTPQIVEDSNATQP